MSTQYLGHFGQAWEMHWTSQGKDGHAVVSSWPEWPWLCSAYVSGPLMIKLCFISFSELCPSLLPPLHYCLFPVPSGGPAVTSDITAQRLQASSQKAFCLVYRTFKIGNGANIWKSGHFTQKKKNADFWLPFKKSEALSMLCPHFHMTSIEWNWEIAASFRWKSSQFTAAATSPYCLPNTGVQH